ncbi:hypothetical protein [Ancylobacter sp. SL191]|uniref:hypothetical protein n=1 Tax=Ancylobacter sp. SL191 TaxID=2995166 RepID=UPI0022706666|nr:hypothetical protein [Ancylobacter sp. SL191]WAC25756.1 hypothetical protein OU996_12015 [Ancylobacter sp. SL191]
MTRREIVQGAVMAMALTSGVAACAPVRVMALAIPKPSLAGRHGDDAIDAHVAEFIHCVRRHGAVIRLGSGRTKVGLREGDGGNCDMDPVLEAYVDLMMLPGARERLVAVCERLVEDGGGNFVERAWPAQARRYVGEWAVPLPA